LLHESADALEDVSVDRWEEAWTDKGKHDCYGDEGRIRAGHLTKGARERGSL